MKFLGVEGSINLRDFGGYRTKDGSEVLRGRLFRSGAMVNLTSDGLEHFKSLDITTICDLRRDEEVSMSPTPKVLHPFCRHIPIKTASMLALQASLEDKNQTSEHRAEHMRTMTEELASDHLEEYRRLFECLMNAEGGFLLHCSAGKDRTGFGAAMILLALGVTRDIVMEDYLLTNEAECLRGFMQQRMGSPVSSLDRDSLEGMMGVRADYLNGALDVVDQQFGSAETYLDSIGVTEDCRTNLKERYLTE